MKAAIMQPYFFPYIGYFQLIHAVDKFVFLDDVNFINRGWINRNRILVNGQPYMFTVSLKDASQNKLINATEMADDGSSDKILKTIEHAYKKAPYFEVVYNLLKQVFFSQANDIATLAKKSIHAVCTFLNIDTVIIEGSAVFNNKQLHGEERIIDINKQLLASDYINVIGGEELYSKENFADEGINLHFLKTNEITYSQFSKDFVPSLSIIDVLMFNEKHAIQKMLLQYEIV
ncbi:MAG TPA: WbqC family protein [Parafilimonas sp.]|nr:WbqC family protein [Parafilimonas sp.]